MEIIMGKQVLVQQFQKNKMYKIGFNKPHLTGKETHYIYDAVSTGKISGNGKYTKLCQSFFEDNYKKMFF